jgi:hypothetical protein
VGSFLAVLLLRAVVVSVCLFLCNDVADGFIELVLCAILGMAR